MTEFFEKNHVLNGDFEYIKNNCFHYILSNLDSTTITWRIKSFESAIFGPFTEEEAIKMIDSIYEF